MVESRILILPLRLLHRGLQPVRAVLPWPRRPRDPDDLRRRTFEVQVGIIRQALGGRTDVGVHLGKNEDDWYLYRPDEVLTRAEDVGRLQSFFHEHPSCKDGGRVRKSFGDLVRYTLPQRDDDASFSDVLAELDDALGDGVAFPDHVVFLTPGWGRLCPATEPEVPLNPQPLPPLTGDRGAGKGVRVSVVDSGWWVEAESTIPWLDDVEGDPEHVNPADIHPYAGHGTFVAGVVRCLAPATEVEVEGFLPFGGAAYESDIARELNEALTDKDDPDLISISAGTYTRRNLGMLAFDELARVQRLSDRERTVLVVAAAGNDATTRPFYPAAYPWVLAVGALDDDGTVCDFSNTGPWVDVYAHGRDLVNAFPDGTYTCHEPLHAGQVRHFKGMAQWSGTSFSTPVVTGSIAAYMSTHGADPRQARDDLVAAGRHLHDPRAGDIVALGPPFV